MKAVKFVRRFFISAVCLLMLSAFISPELGSFTAQFTAMDSFTVEAAEIRVTTANLNMRTGPGTNHSIITVIPNGAEVTVNGYTGDWAQVTYGGNNGFAHGSYLKNISSGVRYTTANLNMRTGPSISFQVILVIPKGAQVTVLDSSSTWFRVSYGGKTGYASSSYLASSQSTPQPPPQEPAVRYTTAALNLRTGPGTGYSIILTMPKGSKVDILSTSSAWPKVRYGSTEGYASPSYLSSTLPSTSTPAPPSGAAATVIRTGNKSSSVKRIALTFDDHGSLAQIRSIMNSLESYGARGTFFPNGDFVKNNPSIIREMATRGHAVENHTYNHKDLTKVSDAEVRNQIRLGKNAIYNATGKYPTLLRPPYGAHDSRTRTIAGQEGHKYIVLWSVDTSDWATTRYGVTITTDYVINQAVSNASHNGIILMHMHSDKTVSGLPTILRRLRDAGYQFVTVNEMVN